MSEGAQRERQPPHPTRTESSSQYIDDSDTAGRAYSIFIHIILCKGS